jgi:hypothetical protein
MVEQVLWRPTPPGHYSAEVYLGPSFIGGGFVSIGGGPTFPFSWTGGLAVDRGSGATYGMYDQITVCFAVRPGDPFELQLFRRHPGLPEEYIRTLVDDGSGDCRRMTVDKGLGIERSGRVDIRGVFVVNGVAVARAEVFFFVQ